MISKVGSYASLFVLFVKMPKIILKFISLLYIPFLIKSTISLSKQNQSVYIKKINSILNKQLTILFWYVKISMRNDIEVWGVLPKTQTERVVAGWEQLVKVMARR